MKARAGLALTEAEQVARRQRGPEGSKRPVRSKDQASAPARGWIDASPALVALLDASGRLIEANRALLEASTQPEDDQSQLFDGD